MSNHRPVALLVSLLLLSAIAVSAQTYMFGRADFPVGVSPSAIAMGDFNKDGITDLAVVNEVDNTVSILLGKSDGTFAPQVTYATGPAPTAVVTGDFNGDGDLDLAITNGNCVYGTCNEGTVSILLGNGDGTFRAHVDYTTGKGPSAMASGDFNGDGKLDLAVTNAQDNTVSVLLGNGDGTFKTQVVYATVSSPQSLIIADFNADGKLDLAVGGSGVSVLLGNGDGTFQKQLVSPGSSPLAAADFNLDGKLDLFAGGSVLLGNGDGTFALQTTSYPTGVAAAAVDLNGDGKPDLVIAQTTGAYSAADASVLIGNGDGTFQGSFAIPGISAGFMQYAEPPYPAAILVTDVNGDGKFDLVVAGSTCALFSCSTPGTVSILLGFGDGTFVGGVEPWGWQLISADFNGDGKPDIAVEYIPDPDFNTLDVYVGNGDGTFSYGASTSLYPSCGYSTFLCPGPFAAGDFNGDGKADIAIAITCCSSASYAVVVFIGNGDGTFQNPIFYPLISQPANVAVGDFNGDGKPDIVVFNPGANTVSVLLNNGDGTFQSHVDYPTGTAPGAIATGDFSGDGKLDIVTATSTGFSLLPGNGNGTFGIHQDYAITGGGISLSVGDFNGDGKLDLAVGSGNSSQVFILLGNGDGTFQTPVGYATGTTPSQIVTADFNADGKLDLAVGGSGVSVLLGNGDGTFRLPIFSFLSGGSIAVADFNQDGLPDVATSGYTCLYSGSACASVQRYFAPYLMLSAPFKAISPGSLNFGSHGVGTTSAPQTITISNPSNLSFNIASIVASGNFSQTNDCGGSIAPGAHCAVTAAFSPTAAGLESGAITITDNTKISPLAVPLSGTGVAAPDFSIGAASGSSASQTISPGQMAKFSLAIAPEGSFAGMVDLTCKLSPTVTAAPTCSLSSSSMQITGTSSQTVQVTVATTAPLTTGTVSHVDFPAGAVPLTWTVMLVGSGWLLLLNRKRLPSLAAPLIVLALASWVGCGGGSSSSSHTAPGTPSGTYTATITATSGSLNHSMTLTIVVQ